MVELLMWAGETSLFPPWSEHKSLFPMPDWSFLKTLDMQPTLGNELVTSVYIWYVEVTKPGIYCE